MIYCISVLDGVTFLYGCYAVCFVKIYGYSSKDDSVVRKAELAVGQGGGGSRLGPCSPGGPPSSTYANRGTHSRFFQMVDKGCQGDHKQS